MLRKKILLLSIFLVSLLAISAVSAADNSTDDIVSISDDNEVSTVDNSKDAINSDESNVLRAEESDVLSVDELSEGHILKSSINSNVEVLSATNTPEIKSNDVLGAINPDSPETEPVLKAKKVKTIKMNVKYSKWTTKKVGKYKIKARLWRVTYMRGYTNYLDIILYKNGKQLSCGSYLSKYQYKKNGKLKWWPKWRHGGANHVYHRYINDYPIKAIKVKFRY